MNGNADDPRPWWDPMGVWQQMAGPAADLADDLGSPVWGARNALQLLVDGVRSSLVGRPVAFGSGRSRVAFTLLSLEASVGHLAAAAGQADDVSIVAENAEWRSYRLASVSARLHNVHSRFRDRPVLVSAPVDVLLVLTDEAVAALAATYLPVMRVEVTESGQMHLRYARRPQWGYLEVRPTTEDGALVLRFLGVGRGARGWRLGRPVMAVRPKVTLPDGVRLTGVEVRSRSVEIHLRADEWRLDYRDLASLGRKSAPAPGPSRSSGSGDST